MLELDGIAKRFGGLQVLDGVSLTVAAGQVFCIIGPNGSGKTTLFNVISGLLRADAGCILFKGREITNLPPHEITVRGISRSFQSTRLFAGLTLLENLEIPQYAGKPLDLLGAVARLPRDRRQRADIRRRAEALLGEIGGGRFYRRRHDYPHSCSLGEQRVIELARILLAEPELILLDEPTQGLNPQWIEETMAMLDVIKRGGKTIVLIEHKMAVVMSIADRVAVLVNGSKIAEDTPAAVRRDPAVISAYLGT